MAEFFSLLKIAYNIEKASVGSHGANFVLW